MADEKDLMEKLTDQAIVALWPKVQQGDSKAIDQMTRLFERKKKLRPKRRYRMSPKALQQRRTAALKTGQHAKQPPGVMMRKAREAEWAVHGRNGFKIDDDGSIFFCGGTGQSRKRQNRSRGKRGPNRKHRKTDGHARVSLRAYPGIPGGQ